MQCPACKEMNLSMTDRQGIKIDYCPQYCGIWLDRCGLNQLIERPERQLAQAPKAAPKPRDFRYPERCDERHCDERHPRRRKSLVTGECQ